MRFMEKLFVNKYFANKYVFYQKSYKASKTTKKCPNPQENTLISIHYKTYVFFFLSVCCLREKSIVKSGFILKNFATAVEFTVLERQSMHCLILQAVCCYFSFGVPHKLDSVFYFCLIMGKQKFVLSFKFIIQLYSFQQSLS